MVTVKNEVNIVVSVLAKVEALSDKVLNALNAGDAEAYIFTDAGINKVVFVGLDKVFEVEAQIPEVVNCIGADFANGILPIIFNVEVPSDELADFLQSKIEPFEIELISYLYGALLNESYPIQILKQELEGDL